MVAWFERVDRKLEEFLEKLGRPELRPLEAGDALQPRCQS